ncbi:MAG: AbfB domain-containing protein [Colwellia sp.]
MKNIYALSLAVSLMLGSHVNSAFAAPDEFTHPGILHTQADFDRISAMVTAQTQPYYDGYTQLINSPISNANWTPRPLETVIRGGNGNNVAQMYIDISRAYQNALLWKITGDTLHGDTAKDILNAWSSTMTALSGNGDRYLASGLFGYQFANAAELMRDYPGFEVEDMQTMLINVFYKPLVERFLIGNENGSDHNDAYFQNYWANWDLANMAATVAIGIFCDRADIYNIGIEYFKHGKGNGAIYNAIPFIHPNGLAQWQESGRDQAHSKLGIGLMGTIAEMAWHQGDDLYGWADNRFLKAAEYVAKYNNGDDNVPFATYEWGTGANGTVQTQTVISDASRSELRPVWEMIYNHYANRKGLSVPNISARATLLRPEGGPNLSYASTFDQTGYGTLLYTRSAATDTSASLPSPNIADGTYRFIARHSDKALDATGSANGASIEQWAHSGGTNQQWTLTHLTGGQYSVIGVNSNRSLDINSASLANGGDTILWDHNNANNQKFAFIPVGDGYHRITPVHSGKPIDISGNSQNDGATANQWRYVQGGNQQWKLEPVSVDVTLQSYNFPERYIRHIGFQARIDSSVSPSEDSEFKMVTGLSNNRGVSFESVNYPGRYLHVQTSGTVGVEVDDNTTNFEDAATFRRVAGLADEQKSSYQIWDDSTIYLRHSGYVLYAQSGSGDIFNGDATFTEISP